MDVFICIIKAILGYLVMILVGTNLIGLIVRGIVQTYKKDNTGNLISILDITSGSSRIITIFSCLVCITYFFALYHYWNIGVVIAASMVMFTRLPDLLYEMKTGEKINRKNMPWEPIYILCTVISWASLPVLWYSLYYIN